MVRATGTRPRARLPSMADVTVTHNPDRSRFEAHLDGQLAGFAEYQQTHELYVFSHTEVDRSFEGRGIGGALARTGLDHVRAEGSRSVLPTCPFIKAWIDRHPDYADLLYSARRPAASD
jgi:uncharacterized protein